MRFFGFILFLVFLASCSGKQKSAVSTLPFYESHIGNWNGTLKVIKNDSIVRELGMTFNLEPIEDSLQFKRFKWQIRYEGQDIRDYQLRIDTVNNTFAIDENNGIVLPAKLNNSNLSNWFTVMGNTLMVNFDFSRKDEIEFTVNMRSKQPVSITGQQNEEIDSVACYEVVSYQVGVLTKKND